VRGKLVPIKDLKAKCPFCHKINIFEMEKSPYGILIRAIENTHRCEHLVNWYRDSLTSSTVNARFEKIPDWRSPYAEKGKLI